MQIKRDTISNLIKHNNNEIDQNSYYVMKDGSKVDMMRRSKINGKSTSDSFDIFNIKSGTLRELQLTVRPSLKKKVGQQEKDVSIFNQILSASKKGSNSWIRTSQRLRITDGRANIKSNFDNGNDIQIPETKTSREKRIQNFVSRNSSNNSPHNEVQQLDLDVCQY